MAEPEARRKLADRAAEIWKAGGKSYSQAVDEALAEMNPTGNATAGEKLLYALLNVEEVIRHPRRRSTRALPVREDMGSDTKAGGPGSTQSAAGDAPDGDDTFTGVAPADSQAKSR